MRWLVFLIAVGSAAFVVGLELPRGPLRLAACPQDNPDDIWSICTIESRIYFLRFADSERQRTDRLIEKVETAKERVEISQATGGMIKRFPLKGREPQFLVADLSLDPPIVIWSEKPEDGGQWAIELVRRQGDGDGANPGFYYLKNLTMKTEKIWLSLGEPQKERSVFGPNLTRVSELRPAILSDKRDYLIWISGNPSAK